MKKGEIPVDGFTDDNGLGMSYYALFMRYLGLKAFGGNQGDKVSYQVKLKESYQDAVLAIRYRTLQDEGDVIFKAMLEQSILRQQKRVESAMFQSEKFQIKSSSLKWKLSANRVME